MIGEGKFLLLREDYHGGGACQALRGLPLGVKRRARSTAAGSGMTPLLLMRPSSFAGTWIVWTRGGSEMGSLGVFMR